MDVRLNVENLDRPVMAGRMFLVAVCRGDRTTVGPRCFVVSGFGLSAVAPSVTKFTGMFCARGSWGHGPSNKLVSPEFGAIAGMPMRVEVWNWVVRSVSDEPERGVSICTGGVLEGKVCAARRDVSFNNSRLSNCFS